MTKLILLLLALIAANAPWFSERLLFTIVLKSPSKHIAWCLLEVVIFYFAVGGIALYAEYSVMGQVAKQHWEFFATTFCMFLVFAFPGFVYRYFWKKQPKFDA